MVISRLSGKWKVSQNQPQQNQASLIEGLKASGQQESSAMAVLVDTATKNARLTTPSTRTVKSGAPSSPAFYCRLYLAKTLTMEWKTG